MEFHGQFDTDRIIYERYFPDLNYKGNCIEVGAVDGLEFSNTLFFERNGWNCLCIEPQVTFFEMLKNNRKLSINYAVSAEDKDDAVFTTVYMRYPGGQGSYAYYNREEYVQCSGISGLAVDKRLLEKFSAEGFQVKTEDVIVKTRTLDWCIKNHFNHDVIDFISIDVEGSELDVLKSFNVNDHNIKLLVIENNFNDNHIEDYLKQQGWIKDLNSGVNDFYVKG